MTVTCNIAAQGGMSGHDGNVGVDIQGGEGINGDDGDKCCIFGEGDKFCIGADGGDDEDDGGVHEGAGREEDLFSPHFSSSASPGLLEALRVCLAGGEHGVMGRVQAWSMAVVVVVAIEDSRGRWCHYWFTGSSAGSPASSRVAEAPAV
jgi:hypothetical protein